MHASKIFLMEEFALLFYRVYTYTCMLILTVNKKSGHEFEKRAGGGIWE